MQFSLFWFMLFNIQSSLSYLYFSLIWCIFMKRNEYDQRFFISLSLSRSIFMHIIFQNPLEHWIGWNFRWQSNVNKLLYATHYCFRSVSIMSRFLCQYFIFQYISSFSLSFYHYLCLFSHSLVLAEKKNRVHKMYKYTVFFCIHKIIEYSIIGKYKTTTCFYVHTNNDSN